MIEVLFEGTHTNKIHQEGHYSIDPLGSSVTLIRLPDVNVLFDTSSFIYKDRLLEALEARGLKPSDIHHVVNSHYHLDHCFNNHLFQETSEQHTNHATLRKDGSVHIYIDSSLRPLPKGLVLVDTPGHTGPDVSVRYEWEHEVWMCVGDAVREDIIRGESKLTAAHPDKFVESMELIFNEADVIVPGHGPVIRGELKTELHALVKQLHLKLPSHVSD
jgi:glyoxylase-like metal-dependent hydrolase (beta-lactamase superfamily II)